MEQQLVDLIGSSDGATMPFEEWRLLVLQKGLNPTKIQNLKRRGLIHTVLEDGVHYIKRGARPTGTA